MKRDDIEREIETLKMAIGINRMFLGTVPAGADRKTEKKVAQDMTRLADLRAMLEVV